MGKQRKVVGIHPFIREYISCMDKRLIKKICSIKKDNDIWKLYDCTDQELRTPSRDAKFTSSMNRHYRVFRKKSFSEEDSSCVWFLVGKTNNQEKWIQVGRTKDLTNLLSNDIKEDLKDFFYGTGKYGQLRDKYCELIFYEIDVLHYIKENNDVKEILGEIPSDRNLKLAYLVNCAAFIEGKESYINKADKYNPSVLDGYYYEYFKNKH